MKLLQSIQISIPQPCYEDWNNMTPQQQGRFCDNCQKCVVDFMRFTDVQLYRFIAEHNGQEICGRLKPWQLNRKVALPQKQYSILYKWFISLGFVIFLSEIFCITVQAQEPIITQVSPVKKRSKNSGTLVGTVTAEDNTPVRGARIIIYQNSMETDRTVTDIDGNYVAKKIVAGTYVVHVVLEGYKKHIVTDVLIKPKYVTEVNTVLTQQTNKTDSVDLSQYTAPPVDRYGMMIITTEK